MIESIQGYKVLDRINANGTEYVVGFSPNAPDPYVTWQCNERGMFWGHYLKTFGAAQKDIYSRAGIPHITYLQLSVQKSLDGVPQLSMSVFETGKDKQDALKIEWSNTMVGALLSRIEPLHFTEDDIKRAVCLTLADYNTMAAAKVLQSTELIVRYDDTALAQLIQYHLIDYKDNCMMMYRAGFQDMTAENPQGKRMMILPEEADSFLTATQMAYMKTEYADRYDRRTVEERLQEASERFCATVEKEMKSDNVLER